jgi:transcriptional activator for dhaKLM operon
MQPAGYPVQLGILRNYWQQFRETSKVIAIEGALAPDPAIIQSWLRCSLRAAPTMMPKTHVLKGNALSLVLRAQSELIGIAIPFMEDMHQFMEGSDSAILLADGAGCILGVEGDASAVSIVQSQNLGVGAYWSEGYMGTNALGVALVTTMPTQVVGAEHFFQNFHNITSTAAPIHDLNGRIIGLIAVVNVAIINSTSHTLSLVMAVARAISNQLHAALFLDEANGRLTELNTILETIAEGVISWDGNGHINHINTQAANMLQLSSDSIVGQSIYDTIKLPVQIQNAILTNVELHDEEVNFELNESEKTISTLVSLRSFQTLNEKIGYLATIRPIEQVRRIVHQQVGTQASLKLEDVFTESRTMRPILRQARIAARGMAPIILHGEGGVGKNHLARAIHNASERANAPFISINCRAIPRELLISEFLGYEKDSNQDGRPSKFELANGGTLLLDRIESLSLEVQSALLHVIETGYVMRLGSIRPMPVDVRIIASTTKNLEKDIADGNFIPHLYYRFGVFNIEIPPLRNRIEDIPQLAERFLQRLITPTKKVYEISADAISTLNRYPWPGNVRELEMVLERAAHQTPDGVIRVIHLPEAVRNGRVLTGDFPNVQPILSAEEAEREAIIRAGMACHGRLQEMATHLRIGRTTLWRKMKRHGITQDYFHQ